MRGSYAHKLSPFPTTLQVCSCFRIKTGPHAVNGISLQFSVCDTTTNQKNQPKMASFTSVSNLLSNSIKTSLTNQMQIIALVCVFGAALVQAGYISHSAPVHHEEYVSS